MGALIPLLQAVTTIGTVASTAMTLSQKPPTPTKPKVEPPADIMGDPAVAAQRMAEQRRRQAGQHGRASTIMSGSPLGQPAPPASAKKYLTGA